MAGFTLFACKRRKDAEKAVRDHAHKFSGSRVYVERKLAREWQYGPEVVRWLVRVEREASSTDRS